jgi:hypothetical protein
MSKGEIEAKIDRNMEMRRGSIADGIYRGLTDHSESGRRRSNIEYRAGT